MTELPRRGMVDALLQGIRTVYRWMDTRRFAWLMAASAGAHIVFVLLLEAHPGVDGRIYQDVTQRIIASGSLTACGALNGAYWPPLFCYLLAGFWLVVGKSPALFFIFNVTVALATALISRQFLRRLFDFRIACWSSFFFFNSMLVCYFTLYYKYELLTALLLSVCLLLLFRNGFSRRAQLVNGFVLGLGALATGRVLALLPVFVFYLIAAHREVPRARRLLAVVALAAGLTLALAPWTARNWYCLDQFIPITTNGGVNFYMGFNEESDGSYLDHRQWPEETQPLAHTESAALYRKGFEYISGHPIGALVLMLRKVNLLWRIHYADTVFFYPFLWAGIFILPSLGSVRSRLGARTIQWLFLSYTLFHMLYIARYYYVIPLLPVAYAVAVSTQRQLGAWLLSRYRARKGGDLPV